MRKAWLIVFLVVLAELLGGTASANPPGDARDPDAGKLLYNFNIVAVPQGDWVTDDAVCTNSAHRIFFERVSSGPLGTITWNLDPVANGFRITDCDATADKEADLLVDEEVEFWVMIRVQGAVTDSLDLTCTDIIDVGVDDLCILNGVKVTYHKDKAFTKVMFNVFDDGFEQVLWTLETSTGFRIAQVRIYEKL
jgi:hypothetical protein